MSTDAESLPDSRTEIRRLSEINHLRTLTKFLLMVSAIAIAFVLAEIGFEQQLILLLVAAFLVIVWVQNALLEELHDGSHYRLVSARHFNEYLAGFYGSLIGISLVNFRVRHNLHHRNFGTAMDPDLSQYKYCPVGLQAWLTYILMNFTGYGAVKSLLGSESTLSTGKPSWQHPGFTIITQLGILALGVALRLPQFYFYFWLAPLLTLTYGISHFRTMIEHFDVNTWQDPTTGETCYGAFYDFDSGIQPHIFGAQFGYHKHGSHHSLPSIPNYNLSQISHEGYRDVPETLIHNTTFFARVADILALSFKPKVDAVVVD
jgi:fatty acid desaturase